MPFLDTSDVLTDPDFCDITLVCERTAVVAGTNGLGVPTRQDFPFSGVVTSDAGKILRRDPEGEHATGSILICSRFVLVDQFTGFTADKVRWNGKRYTVSKVFDYSTYGVGFTEAICDLIPLSG
jgi:galactose-6-phosphate isomerase